MRALAMVAALWNGGPMAKFVVTTQFYVRTVEADNFEIVGAGYDSMQRPTDSGGCLRLYRTVPSSSGTQTVGLFRTWESEELRDGTDADPVADGAAS